MDSHPILSALPQYERETLSKIKRNKTNWPIVKHQEVFLGTWRKHLAFMKELKRYPGGGILEETSARGHSARETS